MFCALKSLNILKISTWSFYFRYLNLKIALKYLCLFFFIFFLQWMHWYFPFEATEKEEHMHCTRCMHDWTPSCSVQNHIMGKSTRTETERGFEPRYILDHSHSLSFTEIYTHLLFISLFSVLFLSLSLTRLLSKCGLFRAMCPAQKCFPVLYIFIKITSHGLTYAVGYGKLTAHNCIIVFLGNFPVTLRTQASFIFRI